MGHLSRSLEQHEHLPGGELRSSGMPHEGYANPIMNDKLRFHLDIPVSELTEHVARVIEASNDSLATMVVETVDGVTHGTISTPTKPNEAQGLGSPDIDSGNQPTVQVVGGTNTGEHPERQKHRSLRPQERVPRCSASN